VAKIGGIKGIRHLTTFGGGNIAVRPPAPGADNPHYAAGLMSVFKANATMISYHITENIIVCGTIY